MTILDYYILQSLLYLSQIYKGLLPILYRIDKNPD